METLECEIWLAQLLSDGEMHLCDDIRYAAKEKGFTGKSLKSARKNLKVRAHHQFDEDGPTGNWFWYLEG